MKKLYSLFALLLVALAVMAAPVSQEQAAAKARAFLKSNLSAKAGKKLAPACTSLAAAEGEADGFFVFNVGEADGFLLVSADDRTPAILGYTDRGQFDAAQLPAHVRAWLASYSDQIRALDKAPQAPRKVIVKRALNPLIQTNWNQDTPYNIACPIFVTGQPCVTGCVATAMSQVMKFYEWPAAIKADIPGYQMNYTIGGEVKPVTVNPIAAGTKLDWANMLNAYSGTETDEQAAAVADLMLAAGASVEMQYKDEYNGGSGAANARIPGALQKYFDYSMGTQFVQRKDYTLDQWNEIIYAEIKAGRPVISGGQSTGGGHAFVVDGYSSDDLFHINWGWGGYCDGYFLLSVVNPGGTQGAGASTTSDGYSLDQNAIIGIQPSNGEVVYITPMQGEIESVEDMKMTCTFFSLLDGPHTFEYGVGYVKEDGTLEPVTLGEPAELERNTGRKVGFNLQALPEGSFAIVPVCRVQGDEQWHTFVDPARNRVDAVSDGKGNVTLTLVAPKTELSISGITPQTTPVAGREVKLDVAVYNKADEYYGPLYLFLSDTPGSAVLAGTLGVTAPASQVSTFTFYVTPAAATEYTVYVATDAKLQNRIGQATLVVFENNTVSDDAAIQVLGATFDDVEDGAIYGYLRGKIKVQNVSEKAYVGGLEVLLLASAERYSSFGTRAQIHVDAEVPAGETMDIPFESRNMKKEDFYWPFIFSTQSRQELYRDATGANIAQLLPGIIIHKANGATSVQKPAADIQVDENAVAVELTGVNGINSVAGGNPNTLYFVTEDEQAPAGLSNVVRGGVAENIVLQDGYDFVSPLGFKAANISYTRTFAQRLNVNTGKGWETIALPFDVTSITAGEKQLTDRDYVLAEFVDEKSQDVVFQKTDEFAAAIPYIIGFPVLDGELAVTFGGTDATISSSFEAVLTGGNFKMQGVARQAMSDSFLTLNEEGSEFVKADGKVNAFHCYFTTTAAAPSSYNAARISIGGQVGISTLGDMQQADGDWFTLDGRRMQRPAKAGIYIHAGKKVIVK